MQGKAAIVTHSGRIALGLLSLAVTAATGFAALTLPLPSSVAHPRVDVVTPVPAVQQRVCPGPLLALGADASKAQSASSFGIPTTVTGTASAAVPASHALRSGAEGSGAPVVISTPTGGSAARTEIVGAQSQQAGQDDLKGFAAAACGDPGADSWLVAGATTLGQTSLLLLSNPTKVTADVELSVWGTRGSIESDGGTGITVAAGTQKMIPLAGLAPNAAALVVRVRSHGGTVLASLQQDYVQGLQPLGVDLASSGIGPATLQRIPGVMVRTLAALEGAQAGDGYGVDLPAVRLLDPGTSPATVTIGAVGETGTSAGNTYTVTAQPGVVTEVPLTKLGDGDYTLTVTSDHPVVAAARTATLGAGGEDFGWFASAAPLASSFVTAVASGPSPRLHAVNPGTADVALTIRSRSGSEVVLRVTAGGAASAALPGPGVYTVSGAKGIVASIGYAGDGALASYPVQPKAQLAAPIRVYTR